MVNSSDSSVPPPPDLTQERMERVEPEEAADYDSATDTYRVSFDATSHSLNESIISTVAAVSGTEPMELPPLYDVLDPDALEALIELNAARPAESDIHVTFTFNGYTVTVHTYGIIAVQPADRNVAN